jgi:hypothetical protein
MLITIESGRKYRHRQPFIDAIIYRNLYFEILAFFSQFYAKRDGFLDLSAYV